MQYVEETVIPETLQQYTQIKKAEVQQLAVKNPRKGAISQRSPDRKVKNMNRDVEQAADRRLKRNLIVSLLDKLHEALDGAVNQDNLVMQVRQANKVYSETYTAPNNGLEMLLNQWAGDYVAMEAPQ